MLRPWNSLFRLALVASAVSGLRPVVQADTFVSYGSEWQYRLGASEASDPVTAWRLPGYDASGWLSGVGGFGYGVDGLITQFPSSPTGNYLSVFFRTSFVVDSLAELSRLELTVFVDDGYVAWINGQRVERYNTVLSGDEPAFNDHAETAIEPLFVTTAITDNLQSLLRLGTNVLALQVFNSGFGSSDLAFDASLESIVDRSPPFVTRILPPPNALVPSLDHLELLLSEPVLGLEAADLLVNGRPATNVVGAGPDQFVFEFPSVPAGDVAVRWADSHGITDASPLRNPLLTSSWGYTVDPLAPPPGMQISEFMADNEKTLRDEDGDAPDWIEVRNASGVAVNLAGWALTDSPDDLGLWRFPDLTLQPEDYLVVFASEKNRTTLPGRLHTNFKLGKSSGYLGLVNPLGEVVSAFTNYPAQRADISYGRDQANVRLTGYFLAPTPGGPNATRGPGFAPEVEFSRKAGTFVDPFPLTLTTADPTAVIHYELDNLQPTEASPVYTGPLNLTNSTYIRARAFSPGLLPGSIESRSYLRLNATSAAITSDLPIMVLHTFSPDVPLSEDQFVTVQVYEPKAGRTSLRNVPDQYSSGVFHRRGSSTYWLDKQSYFLETQDDFGNDRAVGLAGLPKESDWVLYAPNSFEPILMHNPVAFELSRQMGRYASRTRFVELYLVGTFRGNGTLTSGNYRGIYVLEEKIKTGPNRVDIDKLQPQHATEPAVSGGYLLSVDRGDNGFYAAGTWMNNLDPDTFEFFSWEREAQRQYLQGYFDRFWDALNGPDWTDPVLGYRNYFEVDAGIDHHLHGVVTFNVDALRLSGYLHKPRGGRITMGPVWDFDRTQGSTDGRDLNPRLWRSQVPDYGTDMFNEDWIFANPWYSRMFRDPDFWQAWIDRYQELRRSVLSLTNVAAIIDRYADEVRQAQPREVARWKGYGGSDTTPRSWTVDVGGTSYRFNGTYQGEVDFMKFWYSNRLDFIDTNFVAPAVLSHSGGSIVPGFQLAISHASGTPYYTLDGSDPRLRGGSLSRQARTYTGPVTLQANARVFVRVLDPAHDNVTGWGAPPLSSHWSGPVAATFVVETPPLVVSEIMYHPAPPPPGSTNAPGDFEFVELLNRGTAPIQLPGVRLSGGVEFTFSAAGPVTALAPGARLLLVRNPAAFLSRYPNAGAVAGQFTGNLGDDGDRLRLDGPLGEPILDFRYEDDWYPATDGPGFALVIADSAAPLAAWALRSGWRPSSEPNGSPGLPGAAAPDQPPVLINEALTHTDLPQVDTVELFNPTGSPVNVGGWFITDDLGAPAKYRIPGNTTVPAFGYRTLPEGQLAPGAVPGSLLSSLGGEVFLCSADAAGILNGYAQGFKFGASRRGVAFGRHVTSTGEEHFVAQTQPSPDGANPGPALGPVVITELMAEPAPESGAANTRDEYLELHNLTGEPVALFDVDHATNTWRLAGGVDYQFPTNVSIRAHGFILVVNFDPLAEPLLRDAFLDRYNLAETTPLFGPYQGVLDNAGERVALYQPDPPEPEGSPKAGFVPYVLVEAIDYSSRPPWPTNANGTGLSLQRREPVAYGNDAAQWKAAWPSPATPNTAVVDGDGDGLPDDWEQAHQLDPEDPAGIHGAVGDPDGDGASNLQEYLAGTDPRDSSSLLRLRASTGNPGVILRFAAVPGRTYSLLYAEDLGAEAWNLLADLPPQGAGGEIVVPDPGGAGGRARYYRVVTPALPPGR